MYTPYVGFAAILLYRHISKVNYVKIKDIPFVIDLSNTFLLHIIELVDSISRDERDSP